MVYSMANNMSHKLSHTMIRGRTYYTNFRINGSSSFIRISLGTDSFRQAEVLMSRVRPFIPLVQSGAMPVEEFKQRLGGMRELTKDGLDQLLLNVLEINIADADYTSANPRFYSSNKRLLIPTLPCSPQSSNRWIFGKDQVLLLHIGKAHVPVIFFQGIL